MAQQTDHIGEVNKMVTAVEWLIEKMLDNGIGICKEWREQAKQMEKEQIVDAHMYSSGNSSMVEAEYLAEKYYNETYNK